MVRLSRALQPVLEGLCLSHLSELTCLNSPKAEDRPEAVVVRLYEAHGSTVTAWLQTPLPVKEAML